MSLEPLIKQLEELLNTTVRYSRGRTIVDRGSRTRNKTEHQPEEGIYFPIKDPLREGNSTLGRLWIGRADLTIREQELIRFALDVYVESRGRELDKPSNSEMRRSIDVRRWIMEQLDAGHEQATMPDTFRSVTALYTSRIPLLLHWEIGDRELADYDGLKKILETFFDTDIFLVSLSEREWLILAPEEVITASKDEEKLAGHESERIEESLEALVLGLHEMIVSEWIGECHLACEYPIIPAKDLLVTLLRLRESITIGRQFRMGEMLHFPWLLSLEKLLSLIPEHEKHHFVERVLRHLEYSMDAETLQTLEQFFALDCNVSETAKQLYIHRNTLLYRLDKFKQETGLDVRSFSDAVLVKIALLLYKVTKGK